MSKRRNRRKTLIKTKVYYICWKLIDLTRNDGNGVDGIGDDGKCGGEMRWQKNIVRCVLVVFTQDYIYYVLRLLVSLLILNQIIWKMVQVNFNIFMLHFCILAWISQTCNISWMEWENVCYGLVLEHTNERRFCCYFMIRRRCYVSCYILGWNVIHSTQAKKKRNNLYFLLW